MIATIEKAQAPPPADTAAGDRESIAAVLGSRSQWREQVVRLAKRAESIAIDCGGERPHLDAAIVAQALAYAPYTSLALRAHALCMRAAAADLRSLGYAGPELMALAEALADGLHRAGVRRGAGKWRIDAFGRYLQGGYPFPADLAWDVEGMLPTAR